MLFKKNEEVDSAYLDPGGLYLFLALAPLTQNKDHLGSRYIIGDSKSTIQKNTKNCQVYLLKYFPLLCLIFLDFQGETCHSGRCFCWSV